MKHRRRNAIMDMKPIPCDKTENEYKKKYQESEEKGRKAKTKKTRDVVPPVELAWLKLKQYFRGVGERFEMKFGEVMTNAIAIWLKTYGIALVLIVFIFIAIYLLRN